jgi:hypothetical protein
MESDRLISSSKQDFWSTTAPMLLAIVLAICLAVAEVLYFPVAPGVAAFAMGRSLTSLRRLRRQRSTRHAHTKAFGDSSECSQCVLCAHATHPHRLE